MLGMDIDGTSWTGRGQPEPLRDFNHCNPRTQILLLQLGRHFYGYIQAHFGTFHKTDRHTVHGPSLLKVMIS